MALHPKLEPFVPTEVAPFTKVHAAHLLQRAAWGGTSDEIAHVVEIGPRAAADELLDFPDGNADEISPDEVPDLSAIEGYPRTNADRRKLYAGKTREERELINQRLNGANREAVNATARWWLDRMTDGPYPLQEKLTFAWHGHFTTSARDERSAWLMWQQNELLRRNAAGNFRSFVKGVSHDPAMLDYLNNSQNRKNAPNENYARELMELFTLGQGNYSENDIKEVARAFTGWAHNGETFEFNKGQHDADVKNVFGYKANMDGNDVVDLLMKHPASAPYVAGRLIKWFVADNVDSAIVKSLGDVIRENNFELRPALRVLLTSKLFYDQDTIGGMIKSPVHLVVSTQRMLGVGVKDYGRLRNSLEQMGQMPFDPPNVKGWPGGRQWINTSTLFVRYNTCIWLAGGPTGRPLRDRVRQRRQNVATISPDALELSPRQLVDRWVERLIQRPIAEERRAVMRDRVGPKVKKESEANVIQWVVSIPEYQLC